MGLQLIFFRENHNNKQIESPNKKFGHDGFIKSIKWLDFQNWSLYDIGKSP